MMKVPIIPREILFGNPSRMNPQLSPDGRRYAYVAPKDGVLNLWIKTVGDDDVRCVTHDTGRGISMYFWAHDNQHILYIRDKGGDENFRLFSINLDTNVISELTPFDDVQAQLLARNKSYPKHLIIALNKDDKSKHDPYRVNIETGELEKLADNPGNIVNWLVDDEFEIRGALAMIPEGGSQLLVRNTVDSQWREFTTWSSEDMLSSGPLGFTKDGQAIYCADSSGSNTARIVKRNIHDGTIEVIFEDPEYDASHAVIHPDTREIQAVIVIKDRQSIKVLDTTIQDDFERLRDLDSGDFYVSSRNRSDDVWLVSYIKDNGPVSYYAYDRNDKNATFLFHSHPDIMKYTLARMEPFAIKSRDGLTLRGYITFPPGEPRKNLPMVINVHGGPWYRDSWGPNPEVQWLANRGYVCLQVNFRGSLGYGKKFINAGNREWGGKMHDDLVDGMKWAVKQGYADPERIAIYGGSYGGYAALVGAAFTPDLFKCAVDIVGPCNLLTFIETIPAYWQAMKKDLLRRVGDPETEPEFLKSRSPLFKVDQIKIPMLIAQGANDPRVKQAEAEQIVAAMKAKEIDYEYLLFENEGHGFARPENRMTFYKSAEKFLEKHLGGRSQI